MNIPERVFGPESMIWRICRERAVLLHGPAAAVLQVAHPRIGLGVMEHSRFAEDPTARLHRTLEVVHAIAFKTREQATAAAAGVARRHAGVRGDAQAHNVPGAANYSADEIDLLMWVVATLVWSAVGGYERCVGRLTDSEKEQFYADMRVLGTFFGLPVSYGPQSWQEFDRYLSEQLNDPLLGTHPISRRVAWGVARPRRPWWLWLAGRPMTFVYSEILPEAVRERLGFRSTMVSKLLVAVTTWALRMFVRFAPRRLRFERDYLDALGDVSALQAGSDQAVQLVIQ